MSISAAKPRCGRNRNFVEPVRSFHENVTSFLPSPAPWDATPSPRDSHTSRVSHAKHFRAVPSRHSSRVRFDPRGELLQSSFRSSSRRRRENLVGTPDLKREKHFSAHPKMPVITIGVKWGKQSYTVDVDTSQDGFALKTQLFSLTGVPPDRIKLMGLKGGKSIVDDTDLSTVGLDDLAGTCLYEQTVTELGSIPTHHVPPWRLRILVLPFGRLYLCPSSRLWRLDYGFPVYVIPIPEVHITTD